LAFPSAGRGSQLPHGHLGRAEHPDVNGSNRKVSGQFLQDFRYQAGIDSLDRRTPAVDWTVMRNAATP